MSEAGRDWPPVPQILKKLQPFFAIQQEEIYLVGGAVRDFVLRRPFHDYDFVVLGNAIDLAFRIGNFLNYPTYVLDRERDAGRVIVPDTNITIDFASIRHGSLQDDLFHRDFTINALALPVQKLKKKALIDPTGGLRDLEARILRTTYADALKEDPVRTLRAIRFAVELEFLLDTATINSIRAGSADLPKVSNERIRDELIKILASQDPERGLSLMQELGPLDHVLPELSSSILDLDTGYKSATILNRTGRMLNCLEELNSNLFFESSASSQQYDDMEQWFGTLTPVLRDYFSRSIDGDLGGWDLLRIGTLFFDREFVAQADKTKKLSVLGKRLKALRLSREAIHQVQAISLNRDSFLDLIASGKLSRRKIYHYFISMKNSGIDIAWLSIAELFTSQLPTKDQVLDERILSSANRLFKAYFQHFESDIQPELLLDGNDLMDELGLSPGPEVGRLLSIIEEAQVVGDVKNREDAILLAKKQRFDSGNF